MLTIVKDISGSRYLSRHQPQAFPVAAKSRWLAVRENKNSIERKTMETRFLPRDESRGFRDPSGEVKAMQAVEMVLLKQKGD